MPKKRPTQHCWTEEENQLLKSYVHKHLGGKNMEKLSWKEITALLNKAANDGTISNTGQVFHEHMVEIRWFRISISTMSWV
jgi:hypothetical protein